MTIDLPYPHKLLWPNGRTRSFRAKAAQTKTHREWARWAVIQQRAGRPAPADRYNIHITVHCNKTGPAPDADNASAAAKAYLDGIAQELGVNDRAFAAPTVSFAAPRSSRFVIEVNAS